MPARRVIAAGIAWAIAAALLVVPTAAGAATTDPGAPATVPLGGLLRIVPVEAGPEQVTLDALGETPEPAPAPTTDVEVTLVTDDGVAVELELDEAGPEWVDAASGSRFEGAVAVPGEITAAVADEVAARDLDPAGPEVAALVADIAAAEEVALPVVDAQIAPPPGAKATPNTDARQVQALAPPRAHTLDVMWVARAGSPAPSPANLQAAISRLSEFWASQSAGQVSSVVLRTAVQFRTVTFDPCNADQAWGYAAGQFGRTEQSYWSGSTASHLVVLSPATACGPAVGLGTLGGGVEAGGLMWGSIELDRPAEWDQVLFHEFGHNLGLPHSNARVCLAPTTDSSIDVIRQAPADPDCVDAEYQDRYDVMGGGYWVADGVTGARVVSSLRDITALSVVHKAQLDALPRGSGLLRLTIAGGAEQVVELAPVSADAGIRGLELVDALTGELVHVEYRSGTGRDAQSLYAQWPTAVGTTAFAPGVRVLRSIPTSCTVACTIGYSTVLQRHTGVASHAAWMGPGHSQTTYTGALTVTVLDATPDRATVSIGFRDTPLEFTTLPAPTIAGAAHYGSTLSVGGVTADDWMPSASSVRYEWLRDGSPIPRATKSTYMIEAADIGTSISVRVTGLRGGYAQTPVATTPQLVTAPVTARISGADRYETAVQVSKAAFPATAAVVYLATGAAFPDALAAAPAAALESAPLLLVPSRGTVPAAVLTRISQLNPSEIVVVGGEGAIPPAIVAQVRQRVPGATFERLAGSDRYQTARAIIADSFPSRSEFVYVATGRTHADALSSAAAAASRDAPVVLLDGSRSRLDAASRATIVDLGPSRIVIAGGPGAVTAGIEADLAGLAPVTRLAGPSRYETGVEVNREAFPTAPPAGHFWATGLDFPDALAGASLAAAKGAPLFVVWRGCVPPGVAAEVGRTRAGAVTLVGGPGAMFPAVEQLDIC
ncbi:cell wall-binding repeat-containing protein [Microbacterium gallinarum]|uniref:Cell wall-binding repeat-containing protein n=1 Tax=Microbacterium gallinarum TaxID=2762209 RepID=A0ABR8X366_9MICO|nr:cell wall-binding repeat-containing protein [Microbacterium gallinarum]MBD8023761.1 cell wall-binding repeat-containing protein [Microbacterium gallinarum]